MSYETIIKHLKDINISIDMLCGWCLRVSFFIWLKRKKYIE